MVNCGPEFFWLSLLGPAILLVTAIGTALYAKRYHSGIASKRATLEFITANESNEPLDKARRQFALSSGKGPEHLKALLDNEMSSAPDESKMDELLLVSAYLNHLELVAVAIHSGAIDEDMYKNAYRSSYIQAWLRSEEFIKYASAKTTQPTLYENFRKLATNW